MATPQNALDGRERRSIIAIGSVIAAQATSTMVVLGRIIQGAGAVAAEQSINIPRVAIQFSLAMGGVTLSLNQVSCQSWQLDTIIRKHSTIGFIYRSSLLLWNRPWPRFSPRILSEITLCA